MILDCVFNEWDCILSFRKVFLTSWPVLFIYGFNFLYFPILTPGLYFLFLAKFPVINGK
jgi:hypothetical protein